jgi:hypothetical protein
MNHTISVVIATHNSERELVPTLAALVPGALAGLVSEVIIADVDSTDDTAKVADEAGCKFLRGPTQGVALRAAAQAARAAWLLFLAPGTVPDRVWIDEVERFMAASAITGTAKPQAAVFRHATPVGSRLPLAREAVTLLASALGGLPHPAQGLLISQSFYRELGHHSASHPEPERDLLRRIGWRRIVMLRSGAMLMEHAKR